MKTIYPKWLYRFGWFAHQLMPHKVYIPDQLGGFSAYQVKAQNPLYALFAVLIAPLTLLYLAIFSILHQALRPSDEGTNNSRSGELKVEPFEWHVADKLAEKLTEALDHAAPSNEARMVKLRRKDIDYWKEATQDYVQNLYPSLARAEAQKIATKLVHERRRFDLIDRRYNSQLAGNEPTLHSFELLYDSKAEKYVPYASAFHRTIATGGFSRLKLLENKSGELKTKQLRYSAPKADYKTGALSKVQASKNYGFLHKINMADAYQDRDEGQAGMVGPGSQKHVIIGPLMTGDLNRFLAAHRHYYRAEPKKILKLLLPVVDQVSDLHSRMTCSDGNEGSPARYVHMDIKPANILVSGTKKRSRRCALLSPTDDLIIKLIDFDGALQMETGRGEMQAFHRSSKQVVITTKDFLSPEVFPADKSEPVMIGPPADVFALGKTLEVLITGLGLTLDDKSNPALSDLKTLIDGMTDINPRHRLGITQAGLLMLTILEDIPSLGSEANSDHGDSDLETQQSASRDNRRSCSMR